MAGGFVPMGLNLQLQSGVPLQKVGSVLAEKLTITKRMDGGGGGGMGKLMQKIMQDGGLQGIMQNPMAAFTGQIQGQLSGLVGQLQGMVGGAPQQLVSALTGSGGLGQVMSQFQAAGDNLAGLTNGAAGYFQMLGHANTVDLAGAGLPSFASMATVQAPVASGAFLDAVNRRLPEVIAAVVANTMPASAATSWVQAQSQTALDIMAASAAALAWSEQMHMLLATAASVAGSLAVPPTFDAAGHRQEGAVTGHQAVMATLVQPGPRAAMQAALDEQIKHDTHDAVDVAKLTALDD